MTTFLRRVPVVLAMLVTTTLSPVQAGDCGRLCDGEFWKSATPADVQAELAKGANLQARDKEHEGTPLHWAAADTENPAVLTTLLNASADLEARNKNSSTPLHVAAAGNKNPDVVMTLLNTGADLEARNKNGRYPAPCGRRVQ